MYKVRIIGYDDFRQNYDIGLDTTPDEVIYDMSEFDFSRLILRALQLWDVAIEMDGQQRVTIRLKSKIRHFRSDGSF